MSHEFIRAAREAAGAAHDVSGNCDAAYHFVASGKFSAAAQELEWAEENARSAMHRIKEARALIAKAEGRS